ncbi:MAG: sigma-54 dependent transcriptional regulator, partial [Thermoanaerobaculia bacterium]|nr:sigma-54 dependent transcriptional regulator [Thermoanaerobaculia bacterium]
MSAAPLRVLVVDDEEAMREVLAQRLGGWGFAVRTAESVAEARDELRAAAPDCVVSDVMLPDGSGLDVLRSVKKARGECPVVLITAHGTVDLAVDGMKAGAADFLTKPLDYERLRGVISGLGGGGAAELEEPPDDEPRLLGSSEQMAEVRRLLEEVAPTDVAVFLYGESGTGKEVAARYLHARSRRAAAPFVAVNCAAIPAELMESEIFGHEKGAFTGAATARPGCFELADGGTLFLDEIAEMPAALQPKLLRVLEDGVVRRLGGSRERVFDVRQVAATNREPKQAIDAGRLREDLYYRLNVFQIDLPPLRERPGDVVELATHFLALYNARHGLAVAGIDREAGDLLTAYRWPGNVRELRNVVERGVVLTKSGVMGVDALPIFLRRGEDGGGETIELPLGISVAEAEKILILKTLEQTGQNKAKAARRLGVD